MCDEGEHVSGETSVTVQRTQDVHRVYLAQTTQYRVYMAQT